MSLPRPFAFILPLSLLFLSAEARARDIGQNAFNYGSTSIGGQLGPTPWADEVYDTQGAAFAEKADDPDWNPWNPGYLEELSLYQVFRFMNWCRVNSSKAFDWNDRRRKHWDQSVRNNSPRGVAYEWMIDLSNRVGFDPWITIPHLAITAEGPLRGRNDYIRKLAILFKHGVDLGDFDLEAAEQNGSLPGSLGLHEMSREDFLSLLPAEERDAAATLPGGLDPKLRLYIEYSNETWNSGLSFEQYDDVVAQGRALQSKGLLGTANYKEAHLGQFFTAWATIRLFEEFESIYGRDSSRLVRVGPIQKGNISLFRRHISVYRDPILNPRGTFPDVFAAAFYFGEDLPEGVTNGRGPPDDDLIDGAWPEAKYFVWLDLYRSEADDWERLRGEVDAAAELDAPQRGGKKFYRLISYEGGEHVNLNADRFAELPDNYELYRDGLRHVDAYHDLVMHFHHSSHDTFRNSRGVINYTTLGHNGESSIEATLERYPKYRAMRDYVADEWTLFHEDFEGLPEGLASDSLPGWSATPADGARIVAGGTPGSAQHLQLRAANSIEWPLDLAGSIRPTLTFWFRAASLEMAENETALVEARVDGDWRHLLEAQSWDALHGADVYRRLHTRLPEGTDRIRFQINGDGDDDLFEIDDVRIDALPPQFETEPVGFRRVELELDLMDHHGGFQFRIRNASDGLAVSAVKLAVNEHSSARWIAFGPGIHFDAPEDLGGNGSGGSPVATVEFIRPLMPRRFDGTSPFPDAANNDLDGTIEGMQAIVTFSDGSQLAGDFSLLADPLTERDQNSDLWYLYLTDLPATYETGLIERAQDAFGWERVDFRQPFGDPLVILSPIAAGGEAPSVARARRVRPTGFEYALSDWSDAIANHGSNATLAYLAVERGIHRIGGLQVTAQRIPVVKASASSHPLMRAYGEGDPILLTQPQTAHNLTKTLNARAEEQDGDYFSIDLSAEDAAGLDRPEEVGLLSLKPEVPIPGAQAVAGLFDGVGNTPSQLPFGVALSNPFVFASPQGQQRSGAASLRASAIHPRSAELFLEPADPSGADIPELVGWLALSSSFAPLQDWLARHAVEDAEKLSEAELLAADLDGDGWPTMLEYALSTHPLVADSGAWPVFDLSQRSGPTLHFERDPGRNDLAIGIEYSVDLRSWREAASSAFGMPFDVGAGFSLQQRYDPDQRRDRILLTPESASGDGSDGAHFFRLRAEPLAK